MFLLRPHHINCIFFYRGLGYSNDFVDGMNNILELFKKNPNIKIRFAVKCDNLCGNCPHKQSDDVCSSEDNIEILDYNTLHFYNLKENKDYTFNEIIETIYKDFNENKFHKICNACNWYKQGVCNEDIIKSQLQKWTFNT